MAFSAKVGSFTKSTGAATASQAVTGVGFTPKALILFTGRQTATGLATDGYFFIGITDGTTSKSWGYAGGVSGLNQVGKETRQNKALTMCQYDGTGVSQCDLTSFDSDGFTLSWTTNDASAYNISYLALGGSDLSAKVLQWATKSTSGSQSITGVGFQPTGLFTIGGGYTTAPPSTDQHQELVLQAMASGDTAWNNYTLSLDAFGLVNVSHVQMTGVFENVGTATFTSFDSDGWTLNYGAASGFTVYRATLALAGTGIAFKSNKFAKTTSAAPTTQTVNFTTSGSMNLTWNPNNTGTSGPILYFSVPNKFAILAGTRETADGTSGGDHITEFGVTDGTTSSYVIQWQAAGNSSSAHPTTYTGANAFADMLAGGPAAPTSVVTTVALPSISTARPLIDGHLGVSLLTEGVLVR